MATPRSPRQGGLRTAFSSSLRDSHRRHATPERGRRPLRSGRQLPDATPPSILAPSRHADASDPTKRGGLRTPSRLKVRVAHLWHTGVRNAGQQGQPVSNNQAQNGGSRAFRAGFGRSHNPSVVGSSPRPLCQKYSSGAALRRYTGSPGASLTCSTPFDGNLARGSGRRVVARRPRPPRASRAGHRPQILPSRLRSAVARSPQQHVLDQ